MGELEAVTAHIAELSGACDTYKEYERLFELEPGDYGSLVQEEKETGIKYQVRGGGGGSLSQGTTTTGGSFPGHLGGLRKVLGDPSLDTLVDCGRF